MSIKVDLPNLEVEGTITAHLVDGTHATYRIKKFGPDVKADRYQPRLVIELLTGPDNTRSYTGFAFAHFGLSKVNVWSRLRGTEYETKHAERLVGLLGDVSYWMQAGKCRCCGRKLTTPESIKAGVGPVCGGRR